MSSILRDLKLAVRQFRKSPSFATIAVLTLALGIGGTVTMFSVVNGVLLEPLAYRDPGQLVQIQEIVPEWSSSDPMIPANALHYEIWKQRATGFSDWALLRSNTMNLSRGNRAAMVWVMETSPSLFRVLGVQPSLGRSFTAEETLPGRNHFAVLTNGMWRRDFAADPNIIGRTLRLEGSPYTVVGVLPPTEFALPENRRIDLFLPLVITPERLQSAFADFDYVALGRLKPGISLAQATTQLNTIQSDIVSRYAKEAEGAHLRAYVMPLKETIIGHIRTSLWLLLAAVACVLLIVCVNVANLQLARGVLHERYTALRAALGASRSDLVSHVVSESALLALTGGLLGVGLCGAMLRVVPRVLPPSLPRGGNIHLDGAVLGFSVLATMLTVVLAGVLPALRAIRVDPQAVLQREGSRAAGSRRRARLRWILIVIEVLAGTALLLVTTLVAKSLVRLLTVDRGFQTQHILTLQLDLPYATYKEDQDVSVFYDKSLATLKQLPGVESAGLSSVPLLHGATWIDGLRTVPPSPNPQQLPMANMRWVSPDYLPTIGMQLVAGRMLEEEDRGKRNALLSESAARTLWPGQNAVGRTFTHGSDKIYSVAGIIADARSERLSADPTLIVYLPYWDNPQLGAFFTIRTTTDPTAIASSVRTALARLEPEAAITNVQTMDEVVGASLAQQRFEFALLMSFAGTALLLAALGLYGVLSYTVAERTQEMGVRIALGASKTALYRLVFRQATMPVLAGLAGGLVVAWVGSRFILSLLFRVTPYDLPSAFSVAVILVVVALLACYQPARRATRVDPIEALRSE